MQLGLQRVSFTIASGQPRQGGLNFEARYAKVWHTTRQRQHRAADTAPKIQDFLPRHSRNRACQKHRIDRHAKTIRRLLQKKGAV